MNSACFGTPADFLFVFRGDDDSLIGRKAQYIMSLFVFFCCEVELLVLNSCFHPMSCWFTYFASLGFAIENFVYNFCLPLGVVFERLVLPSDVFH